MKLLVVTYLQAYLVSGEIRSFVTNSKFWFSRLTEGKGRKCYQRRLFPGASSGLTTSWGSCATGSVDSPVERDLRCASIGSPDVRFASLGLLASLPRFSGFLLR